MAGKVHLWRKSYNYKRQMTAVARVADNPAELRQFIGTYYALQMLHLHFISIESLRRESREEKDRNIVYRQILSRLRIQRRTLISTYIVMLISVFGENNTDGRDCDLQCWNDHGPGRSRCGRFCIARHRQEFLEYHHQQSFCRISEVFHQNAFLSCGARLPQTHI